MRWSQARTVFELIGELRDRGDEPATWRTHLGHELRRLVGARVVVGVECRLQPRLFDTDILGLSHVGWENERERDAFCSPVEDPAEAAIQAWAGRSHTVARHELLPDR